MKNNIKKFINLIIVISLFVSSFSNVFAVGNSKPKSLFDGESNKKSVSLFDEEFNKKPVSLFDENTSKENKNHKKEEIKENKESKETKKENNNKKSIMDSEEKDNLLIENSVMNSKDNKDEINKKLDSEKEKLNPEDKLKLINPIEEKKVQMTPEYELLLAKYRNIVEENKSNFDQDFNADKLLEKLEVINENRSGIDVSLKSSHISKGYLELNIKFINSINDLGLKELEIKSDDANVAKTLYSDNDLNRIENLLKSIDENLKDKDSRDLFDILANIKPSYTLEDEYVSIDKDSEENLKLNIRNTDSVKVLLKVDNLLKSEEFLKIITNNGVEKREITVVNKENLLRAGLNTTMSPMGIMNSNETYYNFSEEDAEDPLLPKLFTKKYIDYLGDGKTNRDTNVQKNSNYENNLKDMYRVYLEIEGEKKQRQNPVDLLFVLDGSSSMNEKDMIYKDYESNYTWRLSRKEAMVAMLNHSGLVEGFLEQNPENRVAFIYFNGFNNSYGDFVSSNSYRYNRDAHIIRKWSNEFNKISLNEINTGKYDQGTNYCAGLMLAQDFINESRSDPNRKQAMIFLSDGVPTYYIDKRGNRHGNGLGELQNIIDCKDETLKYINYFYKSNENIKTYTVGISRDINSPQVNESVIGQHSPVVLKEMARLGRGRYIGITADTHELVEALKSVTDSFIHDVSVEDTLSEYVELFEEKPDIKIVKKIGDNETIIFKNEKFTKENGNHDIISFVDYDNKKLTIKFNPKYKLEENAKYIISYNIKTNGNAVSKYKKSGYNQWGDDNTDFNGNATSSGKKGFPSNKEAIVNYNTLEKKFPHPVVQVRGYELPQTGGKGVFAIKVIGAFVILAAGVSLIRKKK